MRERPALAERHVVQVHLEDLVLRRARRRGPATTHISSSLRLQRLARARSCSVQPSNCGRKTLRTSCCVIVLPPARYGALAADVREDARRRCRSDRRRDGRSSGDPRSRARPAPRDAGIADSATGRRFSRSPLMSDVSSGASSVEPLARPVVPSSSRSTRSGGLRRRRVARPRVGVGRRRSLEHDADDLALRARGARGMIAIAPSPTRTRPAFRDRCRWA